tara:strand:+ start:222 stop:1844 length:1623 start_codon:yes stop_codon:yes gene_type:complete
MKRPFFKLLFLLIPFVVISQQKDPEYYYNFANDSLWEKDNRLYIEYITKSIELDSTKQKYFFERYLGLKEEGDFILALKDLKKAIQLDSLYPSQPRDSEWHNPTSYYEEMAILLFEMDNRYYDALDAVNKAIELEDKYYPEGYLPIYNLKKSILDYLGKYSEAIELTKFMVEKFDVPDFDENLWLKNTIEEYKFKIDNLEKDNFKRRGGFYPYTQLYREDSIRYPFLVELEFNLKSITDLRIDNNSFVSDISSAAYTTYPPIYVARSVDYVDYELTSMDSIRIADLEKSVKLLTKEGKKNFSYDLYSYETARYQYSIDSENENYEFDHVWNLSDFPFDEQKLEIKFLVELDTSVVIINKNQSVGIKNHFMEVAGLPLGQKVEKVNFHVDYYNSGFAHQFSPEISREAIYPVGVFEIIVSRSGSFLFIKLFVGTFLAYIMSLFAFTIRKRNFGSRIDVSVGALFIAIGNKFFAESETPMVQILTKADVINNISLLLIIMNVIFIIGQHRTDINLGKFEDSYFTLKFSAVLISLLVFLTIIA